MSRKLLLALCSGMFPALALAAAAPVADADRELQALKAETLDLTREVLALERAQLYPAPSQTSVYVNVRASGFQLDSVTVRIVDSYRHDYADSESLALLKDGGWHRLARLRLEPGSYRLTADFKGHFFDAKPGEPPAEGHVETPFDKGAADLDLVLPITRDGRLDRPSRTVSLAQPEVVAPLAAGQAGGPNDPRYRTAVFLKNDGRYLSALIELGEIARPAAQPEALPGSFQLLMAECYLGFGMDSRAGALYQKVAASEHDTLTLFRARLQLAQFDYQHGRTGDALERLKVMRERLPTPLRDEWRVLMTNTLLALGRYAETVTFLEEQGLDSAVPALRYNLAVALIRDGKVADGRKQLDKVGRMDVSSLDQLVLRDKANLTLGYQYLQDQDGPRARTVFGRIRTTGPFSNRALLGLGWAEIAQPPVARQETPAAPAAPAEAEVLAADSLGTLLLPAAPAPGARLGVEGAAAPSTLAQAEQDALRRALVAWVELVKRDAMDPAVQEGMLAIPWALDRLQAYEQSLARYLAAIQALENARKRMDEAMTSIRGGRMVKTLVLRDTEPERGWMWRLRNLPDVPETFFLQSVLAEHPFQEALKSYRDARLLARHLDDWSKRAAELPGAAPATLRQRLDALRPRVNAVSTAQDDLLEAISSRELQGQRSTIERYLTEARFAVARIYDRQAQQAAP
jgi:tetratricopeptide (TPR) repeat protein